MEERREEKKGREEIPFIGYMHSSVQNNFSMKNFFYLSCLLQLESMNRRVEGKL